MTKNNYVKILTIFINWCRKLYACSKTLQITNTVVWTSSSMQWCCHKWHHVPCKMFRIKMFKIEVVVKSHFAYHWEKYTLITLMILNYLWAIVLPKTFYCFLIPYLFATLYGIMTYNLKLHNLTRHKQPVLHSGCDPGGSRIIRMSVDAYKSWRFWVQNYSCLFKNFPNIPTCSYKHSESTWEKVI